MTSDGKLDFSKILSQEELIPFNKWVDEYGPTSNLYVRASSAGYRVRNLLPNKPVACLLCMSDCTRAAVKLVYD